jgi:predicted membrane protein
MLSLIIASTTSVAILLIPQLMTSADNITNHGQLMVVLFGVMLSFIHGVGFRATAQAYRLLTHPFLGWILIVIGFLPFS